MNKYCFASIFAVLTVCATTSAFAQSDADPFAAYEGSDPLLNENPEPVPVKQAAPEEASTAKETQTVEVTKTSKEEKKDKEKEDVIKAPARVDNTKVVVERVVPIQHILERHRLSVGFGTTFAFDSSSTELVDGTKRTNSTFYTNLGLNFGYNVWERVTLELSVSTLWRRMARQKGDYVSEHDWVFRVLGWYSYPIWERAAVIGGVGLGGYFGSSEQEVESGGKFIDENTDSAGFTTDVYAGITYILGDAWQLRMLFNFNWMIGSEKVPSLNKSLANSSTHVGIALGVNYTF